MDFHLCGSRFHQPHGFKQNPWDSDSAPAPPCLRSFERWADHSWSCDAEQPSTPSLGVLAGKGEAKRKKHQATRSIRSAKHFERSSWCRSRTWLFIVSPKTSTFVRSNMDSSSRKHQITKTPSQTVRNSLNLSTIVDIHILRLDWPLLWLQFHLLSGYIFTAATDLQTISDDDTWAPCK